MSQPELARPVQKLIAIIFLSMSVHYTTTAVANDFNGTWDGSWSSSFGGSGGVMVVAEQNGSSLTGTMSLTQTDCGSLYGLPMTGTATLDQADFTTSTNCDGAYSELRFTHGMLANNRIQGSYAVYVEGDFYDSGSFELARDVNRITASAGSGGSISPSGSLSVSAGSSRTFTISPSSGFVVSDVLVDGTAIGAVTSHTFTDIQANHTISAAFATAAIQHTITATAGSGGQISPSGDIAVDEGGSQSFVITPQTGYRITAIVVDGAILTAQPGYTFSNVSAAHTIAASFQSLAASLPPIVDLLLND